MITLLDDPGSKVLTILKEDEVIFRGNYWDLAPTPSSINRILRKLGIDSSIQLDPEPLPYEEEDQQQD